MFTALRFLVQFKRAHPRDGQTCGADRTPGFHGNASNFHLTNKATSMSHLYSPAPKTCLHKLMLPSTNDKLSPLSYRALLFFSSIITFTRDCSVLPRTEANQEILTHSPVASFVVDPFSPISCQVSQRCHKVRPDIHAAYGLVRYKTGVKWTPLSTPSEQHFISTSLTRC